MRIHTGGVAAFRMATFAPPTDRDIEYLRDRLQHKAATYGEAPRRYAVSAMEMYDTINSSDAIMRARSLWRTTNSAFTGDYLRSCTTVKDFQTAGPTMQRWIMACKEVREAYHKQRIDGYHDTYVDASPGLVGDQHVDYRIVMDGVMYRPDDESDDLCFDMFYDLPEDEVLEPDQRHDILDTWALARHYLVLNDADITSAYGCSM